MPRPTTLLLIFLGILSSVVSYGAEVDFLVGFGRKKITPSEPLWMSGYSGRHQPATGVIDDLYAQALAIRDKSGNQALLLRLDVGVLRNPTVTQICNLIKQRTGLMRREILVNVSHTHSGPAVDELYHYPMPTEQRIKLAAYMEQLKSDCAAIAEDAFKDLKPAILDFGVGEATFFHNRRGLDENGRYTGMRENPDNHADRDVPVLKISNTDGSVRGVIFGAACHNVTLGPNYEYSGDYAGQTRLQLEKEIPHALFVTGCGGDANPSGGTVQQHGITLSQEVKRVLLQPMKRITGPIKTAFRYVELPLVTYQSRIDVETMRRGPYADYGTVNKLLTILDRGAQLPTTYAAPFAVWQFGNDLTLAGLPEEAVSEYVPLLKKAVGPKRLWTAGYCNDVSAYLPTENIIKQGGYETRGFIAETTAGWFTTEVEKTVVETVTHLVRRATSEVDDAAKPSKIETFSEWQFEEIAPYSGLDVHGEIPRAEQGLRFDGKSHLEGPSIDLPAAKTKGLTLSAWVKPDPAGMTGVRMIVCEWANAVNGDRFSLSINNGRPGLAIADGIAGAIGFACDQKLDPTRWTFVAVTWHPRTRRYCIYLDGKLTLTTGTQSGNGINAAGQVSLKIGAQATEQHPRYFIGLIDDVWIGNALNPIAIEQRFKASKAKH